MSNRAYTPSFVASLLAAAIVAAVPAVSEAQWTFRSAPDAIVRQLRIFPNTPSAGTTTLYAATFGGGVLKGADDGIASTWNWQVMNAGLPSLTLWAMVFPTNASGGYVGTDGAGVYATTDGGTTWTALNGSGGTALGCLVVRALSIPGTVPTTLYAGTACRYNSGLYKSADSGATWARVGTGVIPADTVVSSVIASNNGATVLLATSNHGFFVSTDSGVTWAQSNTGLPGTNPNVFNVQFAPTAGTLIAYVEAQGVYRSTNTGASWSNAGVTGLPANPAALAGISRDGAPNSPIYYLALDKLGIYRSTDAGLTWSVWGNSGSDTHSLFARNVATDTSGSKYYIGTLDGVAKTTDNGLSFSSDNMHNGRISALTHDVNDSTIAYGAAFTAFKIDNFYSGSVLPSNATQLDAGITGTTIDGVVSQDPINAAVLYATTNHQGIFKSVNTGTSWSAINAGLPSPLVGQAGRLTIDSTNTQTLYLGFINTLNGIGVFKSTDGGTNWAAMNTGLATVRSKSINRIEIDASSPSTLYAATGDGVYKSINGGGTWSSIYSAMDSGGNLLGVSNIRLNPSNTQEVYIANSHADPDGTLRPSSGILKSINGGTSWSNVLPSVRAENLRVLVGGTVFAGLGADVGQSAVMRSIDGGTSWQPYSAGLQGSNIHTFGTDHGLTKVLSLSLENAIYTFGSVPDAPTIGSALAGDAHATISFTAPANNGGFPITGYTATCNPGSFTGTGSASPIAVTGLSNGTPYTCSVTATNSVGTGAASGTVGVTPAAGALNLLAVRSRKTHGAAGTFDLAIDVSQAINQNITVESRSANPDHAIVFQFDDTITNTGNPTCVDSGSNPIGSVSATFAGQEVTVTLSGIPDNKRVTVSLSNVNGGALNVAASLGFMVGDVNNSRSVSAADILAVKFTSGNPTNAANFRNDLNVNGTIAASDILAAKFRSGTVLSP